MGEGATERANACVRDDIAPHIVATEWYKRVPWDSERTVTGGGGQACRDHVVPV